MFFKASALMTLLFFLTAEAPPLHRRQLIVWNVGQGSWTTVVLKFRCIHFDMGGENAPLKKIGELCRNKKNAVYFSHWDWDHIGFTQKARQALPNLCVAAQPGGPGSAKKKKLLRRLPSCKDRFAEVSEVPYTNRRSTLKKLHTANAYSRIFTWDQAFLFSGDSPVDAENIWMKRLAASRIKWFALGHHGSRTSNSQELLDRLVNLQGAIASARRRRYGHPHPEVVRRLRDKKIPLLVTEDWGNLHFILEAD